MRFVLCWSHISGYMASCWRALAARPGVNVDVIAFEPVANTFAPELMAGFSCRFLKADEQENADLIESLVVERRPDVLYISGWSHPAYRRMLTSPALKSASKWMGVDTPWRGTLKQQLGRVLLRPILSKVDRIFVAGERAWQNVRRLGVPESKVRRGMYGIDYASFVPLYEQRCQLPGGWPLRFLYIGRYHSSKGIDKLLAGYAQYRKMVADPWPLGCCGFGELEGMLSGREGVENYGFRQPAQLDEIMRTHGAFVLASEFDPWPLVVVEACAAGLPVVCTEACGSAVELIRPYYNGLTVATGDAGAFARGLRWIHQSADLLPEMGRRGTELAAPYSAQLWATRWSAAAEEAVGSAASASASASAAA